jgi:hypothetical protein
MSKYIDQLKSEQGNVLVVALMFLVVLTLIGIFATRTANIDLQIAANEIPYKRNFYLTEGGVNREAAEIGRGSYVPPNVSAFPTILAEHTSGSLPAPAHQVFGEPYEFTVRYMGFFPAPSGYSSLHFSRYDYDAVAREGNVRVAGRYYRIGPKAE